MSLTNFRAQDFKSARSGAKRPSRKKAAAKKAAAAAPQADPNAVPDGTSDEVLRWAGEDKDRARRALEKENAGGQPRVTLTGPLERLLAEPEPESEPQSGAKPVAKKAPAKKAAKKAEGGDK